MKKVIVSMFVVLSSFSVMALDAFAALDEDKNGVISLEEAKVNPSLLAKFKELDKDNNGELSKKEFSGFTL